MERARRFSRQAWLPPWRTRVEDWSRGQKLGVGDSLSYFGQEPTHALQDLLSIGDEQDRQTILKIGVPVKEHLWVYASPPDPANEGVSGEAVGKVIAALRRNFKYVILDGTANYSDAALSAFDMSDSVCLIAGLDVVGVRHLSVALQTMLSLGFPSDRFRFILNRADSKVGLSVENVEQIMKLKADGLIPSSRLVPASLNQGRTVVDEHPNFSDRRVGWIAARACIRDGPPRPRGRGVGRGDARDHSGRRRDRVAADS